MIKAAVIGQPIGHSLSPAIFTFLSHQLGTPLHYSAQEVGPEQLAEFLRNFRAEKNALGLNVTLPHKETLLAYLDEQTPEVQLTGAANVVHKIDGNIDSKNNGKLVGYNTDVYGILRTLKLRAPSLEGKKACILGAGGAAKAALVALGHLRLKRVDVLNRTPERVAPLVEKMRRIFPDTHWGTPLELGTPYSLCINTTPVGMNPGLKAEGSLASMSSYEDFFETRGLGFEKNAIAFDLIYRPENTPFLQIAQRHGLLPVGGLEMLVEQALATWKIWCGPFPDPEGQKEPLLEYLKNCPIYLTGFMGAGKSTVGESLARRLQRKFVDLDKAIEEREGCSIREIFEKKGETAFRELECQEYQRHFLQANLILSLGGGTLLNLSIRSHIEKTGTLVYLRTTWETLMRRLSSETLLMQAKGQGNGRPLLADFNAQEQLVKIKDLFKAREIFYLQAAIQVDTDTSTPEELATQISKMLE